MALKKAILLASGYSPEYYKIIGMNLNFEHKSCTIILEAWKDQLSRDDNAGPMPGSRINVPITNEAYETHIQPVIDATIVNAYGVVKASYEPLADAEDLI